MTRREDLNLPGRKTRMDRGVSMTKSWPCRDGQRQIGPIRARNGTWSESPRSDLLPDQYKNNEFLGDLSESQRDTLADMLEVLKIEPFLVGYEGSPCHYFIGRLDDWEWPEK